MKLTELAATFVHCNPDATGPDGWRDVATLAEANGLLFTCPKCPDGHSVVVWFAGVPLKAWRSGPGRWHVTGGTGLGDLTLSPSIQTACWHGWVRSGETETA